MKRSIVAVVAAATGVAVVAGAAIWWFTRPESVEAAAQRYLHALEAGDRGALSSFLTDTPGREQLLDAFDGATAHIADAQLDAGHGDGSFRADVTLGGASAEVFFALSDASGSWRLAGDHLATLEVTTTLGTTVAIGEATFPVGAVHVLPAQYTVRASPTTLLTGEATVSAANDGAREAHVEASFSPAATAAVQSQLDAYAEACTVPATAVPAHCGLRVPWAADLHTLRSLDFRIDQLPHVQLDAASTSFQATNGVVVATARGAARDGGDGEFTYRADDWALRGTVRVDGETLIVAVD